jgi:cellulose synthase/poly-beta-1,6-N-acetylglucosamine synthase-like glycosyltransferase
MIKFRSQKTFNEFVIILIIPKKVWFLPKLQQIKEIKNILGLDDPYDLSIIIVNYNTADFIVDCLNSIAPQQGVNFEVIIVDNASEDRSPDIVINDFPWVNLVPNETNVGFAKANNQALKICSGRFVYYLNPDTRVRSGAFRSVFEG